MSALDPSNSLDGIGIQEKNSKMVGPSTVDRISVLPCNILDCILGRLPIKSAVTTSILSRSWRYKWVTMPSLDFDDDCVGEQYMRGSFVDKLVNVVYRVLLSHSGQVETFKFSTSYCPKFSHFDQWINSLSRKGMRKLSLKYATGKFIDDGNTFKYIALSKTKYKLPACVFSHQLLTHLHISNCLLEPPPTFEGFGNLVSLHLIGFTMDGKGLENLIRNSPVLESLVLTEITNLARFTIHDPKLRYLFMDGEFGNICLENTPLLSDISFNMALKKFARSEPIDHGMYRYLVHALGCLSHLKSLHFVWYFPQALGCEQCTRGTSCLQASEGS